MSFSQQSLERFFSRNVNLSNCDREQIHLLTHIQPFGYLFVLSYPELQVLQASENWKALGMNVQDMLGKPLSHIMDGSLQTHLKAGESVVFEARDQIWEMRTHIKDDRMLLELEKKEEISNPDFLQIDTKIQECDTVEKLLETSVEYLFQTTGIDRVMLYRFDEQFNGKVVAERTVPEITPYLHLHYPASDIPRQVRYLYHIQPYREIPDITYVQTPLIPSLDPQRHMPTDLSLCMLRGVSPIHLEYLSNMNTNAAFSHAIIVDDTLWGIIALHHRTPVNSTVLIRETCKYISDVLQKYLPELDEMEYQHNLALMLETSHQILTGNMTQEQLIIHLLERMESQGLAIISESATSFFGTIPEDAFIKDIVRKLPNLVSEGVFETNQLSYLLPEALKHTKTAAGLLAFKTNKGWLLFFRAEKIQTIHWAGDPTKTDETLTPRKSFEVYKEIVKNKSDPWNKHHIAFAKHLFQDEGLSDKFFVGT